MHALPILLLVLLALLPACSSSAAAEGSVDDLRAAAEALAAKPEHDADVVEVQHLLVAHGQAGVPGVTRSIQEAEVLAARLYGRIEAGEDFATLVDQHSDDPGRPGIYVMVADPSDQAKHPGSFVRDGMVAAFGDVGWRLEVGEVGVAPYHASKSPYGWHIVKRLK